MFLPKEEIEVTSDLAVKYTNAVAVETALLQQANAYPINGKIPAATNNRVYELQLLKKTADGSYVRATNADMPAGGITVILPYPKGNNSSDYAFAVAHMLAEGPNAGSVEFPEVTLTAEGIQIHVTSLSPVAITWVELDKPVPATTQPTPTPDDSQYYTCKDCGYHNWTAVDGGYKCDHCGRFEAKDLSAYPNVKGAYKPAATAAASDKAKASVSNIPATSDDMPLGLLAALLVASAAALAGLAIYRKKRK